MFITYVYDFHEQIGLIKIGLINTTRMHYFAQKKLNVFLGVWPRTPFSAQLVPRPTILRSPPANRPGYRPTAAPTTSEKDSFLDATDPLTLLPNKLKTFLFHNMFYLPFAHEKEPLLVCSRGAQIPIVQNPLLFFPLSQYLGGIVFETAAYPHI